MSLEIIALRKSFRRPDGGRRPVVDIASFSLDAGGQLALRGRSGCGKSTFLNLVSGLLGADSGSVCIGKTDIQALGEHARDRFRADHIGLVFQTCNLLQGCTVLENVRLGASFGKRGRHSEVDGLLRRVGLWEERNHFPRELSLGQQQRVAVARALVKHLMLVLADEPTSSADPSQGEQTMRLLSETCRELGASLLVVSHDERMHELLPRSVSFAEINQVSIERAS